MLNTECVKYGELRFNSPGIEVVFTKFSIGVYGFSTASASIDRISLISAIVVV